MTYHFPHNTAMTMFNFGLFLLALPTILLLLQGVQGESQLRGVSDSDSDIERKLDHGDYTNIYTEELGSCFGATCGFWGDPHIITCDRRAYDCQGIGLFTMMENHMYNIQANFVDVSAHEHNIVEDWGLTHGASVTNDVAIDFVLDDSVPVFQLGYGNLNNRPDGTYPSEDGCTAMKYNYPHNMPGQHISTEPNLMACRQRCEVTQGCTKFHFWYNGHCYLNDDNQHSRDTPADWGRSLIGDLSSNCGKPPAEMEIEEQEQRLKHGRIGAECPLLFFVDGEMIDISNIHGNGYLYGDENSDVIVEMVHHYIVRVAYNLENGDHAEVWLFSKGDGPGELWSCHWDLYVCLPESHRQQFEDYSVGLFGTPDGNMGNDFMDANGDQLLLAENGDWHETMIDYCYDNWCVSQEDSLFSYAGEMTYEDVKCADHEYDDYGDGNNNDCVLSLQDINAVCDEMVPILKYACEVDCCMGGCGQISDIEDEITGIIELNDNDDGVIYDPPVPPTPVCAEGNLVGTSDTVCPLSQTPIVKLIQSSGGVDIPEGADIFYDIHIDTGADSIDRTVKFRVANPFDTSADVFVKYEMRAYDSAFMDPHCDEMSEITTGCLISAPEIEVACYNYEGSNPFALVKVYFASTGLPIDGTSSVDVDKCCYPPEYGSSTGVVAYIFEIQCHCPDDTTVE